MSWHIIDTHVWGFDYWLDIRLLIVLYWTMDNSVHTVINRCAESGQIAHRDINQDKNVAKHTDTLKRWVISFPQHNHMGQLCLCCFYFTYRESMFTVLSCISTVLTPTAEKHFGPFKVDLLEGRETTGRCHGEINLQSAYSLEIDKYVHVSQKLGF